MIMTLMRFALLALALSYFATGQPQVQLAETTLTGSSIPGLQQEFFGGIPFAEPPLGPLRFAPPLLKLNLGVSTFDASQFGVACPQPFTEMSKITSMSEDCLTINVFRPAGLNSSSSLPVMVWVYGGAYSQGSASVYNASLITYQSITRATPIIYVNFNYRLGPLGFPQGREAEMRGATNLGNRDALAALTWVQNNIAAFGGDKDKVTIFGESAGSTMISQMLLNESFDLARAAILESGSASTATLVRASDREEAWHGLVSKVPECSSARKDNTFDCLRAASSETLINATISVAPKMYESLSFVPVIDGPNGIIPELPSKRFARGHFARIPFIAGTNLDEATLFVPLSLNSTEPLRELLVSISSPPVITPEKQELVIDTILDLYPDNPALGSPFGTGNETFGFDSQFKRASAVLTDIYFTSLRRQFTHDASIRGVKVFAYLFTDPQIATLPAYYGVTHASEVTYVYGVPPNGPASTVLASNMIDYWISFATSLDPNDGHGNISRPVWTTYTPACNNVMELNSLNLSMVPDTFRAKQISFLNAHPKALLH